MGVRHPSHIPSDRLLLFDETFAQPCIFAVVNRPVVALSVFYFTVYAAECFCSNELLCVSVECCVLLRSPDLERWQFMFTAVTHCKTRSQQISQNVGLQTWNDVILWRRKQRLGYPVKMATMPHCSILEFGTGQARNQLGTPGGAKSFPRGAQIFWTISNSFKLCLRHFPGGRKFF